MTRRCALVTLVLLVAALATGCVRMPEDGPVVETRSGGDVASDSGIYFDPRPPQKGATRPDIVRGFLTAMRATPIDTTTAREFLTKDAATSWNPQKQMITYADSNPPREAGTAVEVGLSDPDRLDSRGAWRGALPASQRTLQFPMSFEDGEWRIDRAPNALIVPEAWFEQRFRQVSLYFFDPTAAVLVPEPVFVPQGVQLASTLLRGLLMGPGRSLDQVAQSFIPPDLEVSVSVPVSGDGIADIPLKGDVGQLTPDVVQLMMAQFAWTLRQEPGIKALRVTLNGVPVPLPGGASSYRVDGGAEYDPAGFQASPLLYGLRAGKLVSGPANSLAPVDGPLGAEAYGVRSIGVDLGATRVAGVSDDGSSVIVAPLAGGAERRVRTVLSGRRDLLRPAWDFDERLWLLDRARRGAEVSYVEGGQVSSIVVRGVSGRRVRTFLVSRDGSRLVAVVRGADGDTLVVSRIRHSRTGRVLGATRARQISSEAETTLPIRGIAWRTATSIAVLNPFPSGIAQVSTSSVDGSPAGDDSTTTTVEGRVRALAGSPAEDEVLYAVTRAGAIDMEAGPRLVPLDKSVSTVVYVG